MTFKPQDPVLVARGLELVRQGHTPEEAGKAVGLGGRTLRRAMKGTGPHAALASGVAAAKRPKAPPVATAPALEAPVAAPLVELDLSKATTALETVKVLFKSAANQLRNLPQDSPRVNPLRNELRQLSAKLAELEAKEGARESPEEAERRRRREDGETRREIEQYVVQQEALARTTGWELDPALEPRQMPDGRWRLFLR